MTYWNSQVVLGELQRWRKRQATGIRNFLDEEEMLVGELKYERSITHASGSGCDCIHSFTLPPMNINQTVKQNDTEIGKTIQ